MARDVEWRVACAARPGRSTLEAPTFSSATSASVRTIVSPAFVPSRGGCATADACATSSACFLSASLESAGVSFTDTASTMGLAFAR